MSEWNRLLFIHNRDGAEEAIYFARQTIRQYRKCVLRSRKRGFGFGTNGKLHHASLPEYRRGYIGSYIICKKFIRGMTE